MKRQIIKTKPVRPYRVARAIIAAVVIILIAAVAWFVWEKAHPVHATSLARASVQDSSASASNAQRPVS